jgi:TIR domain
MGDKSLVGLLVGSGSGLLTALMVLVWARLGRNQERDRYGPEAGGPSGDPFNAPQVSSAWRGSDVPAHDGSGRSRPSLSQPGAGSSWMLRPHGTEPTAPGAHAWAPPAESPWSDAPGESWPDASDQSWPESVDVRQGTPMPPGAGSTLPPRPVTGGVSAVQPRSAPPSSRPGRLDGVPQWPPVSPWTADSAGGNPAPVSPSTADDPGQLGFTAACPAAVTLDDWSTLVVVLHRLELQNRVNQLLRHRVQLLNQEAAASSAGRNGSVLRGATLTIQPRVPGVVFNPTAVDLAWYEDINEVSFRMLAEGPPRRGVFNGSVEVSVGPLLVALIPIGFRLRPRFDRAQFEHTAEVSTAMTLGRVFVSFSRRDLSIVDACGDFYRALGVEVMLDHPQARSGDDWRLRLHELIDTADVFQLYWSAAAATSREVEHEWRYALTLTGKGSRFIRPIYWEPSLPPVPGELSRLQFSHLDLDHLSALRMVGSRTG